MRTMSTKAQKLVLFKEKDPCFFACFSDQDLNINPMYRRYIIEKEMDDDIDTDDD